MLSIEWVERWTPNSARMSAVLCELWTFVVVGKTINMASVTTEFAKLTQDERAEIKEQFYTVSSIDFYTYWLGRKTGFRFVLDTWTAATPIMLLKLVDNWIGTCRFVVFSDIERGYLQQLELVTNTVNNIYNRHVRHGRRWSFIE